MGYNNPLNEFNQPPVYDDYEPSEHVMVPKIMKKRHHRDIEHLTEQFTGINFFIVLILYKMYRRR